MGRMIAVGKAVGALHKLWPNLGELREVRRLYASVVRYMVLYAYTHFFK